MLPEKPLKKFSRGELNLATNNFSDDKKMGEGEFGSVYKRYPLSDLNLTVAVKKIPRVSKERIKVYVQEMTNIRTILHDNLVQLIGWSFSYNPDELMHELIDECSSMSSCPIGNLHNHLFGKKRTLNWRIRYKSALRLAYALLFCTKNGSCLWPTEILNLAMLCWILISMQRSVNMMD